MKAYHLMLYLFIFNMFFWTVTEGLGIFNTSANVDENFNLSTSTNQSTWTTALGLIGKFTMLGSYGGIVLLAGALAGGAMIGYFTSGQASHGIVYGLFSFFFWTGTGNTLTLFYNLSGGHIGALYVLTIFGMIIGIVFVVGLFQMVTGGWKTYE